MDDQQQSNFAFNFMIGGAIGGVSVVLGYPFKRFGIVLQTQHSLGSKVFPSESPLGLVRFCSRIVGESGFLGMWRGVTPQILIWFPNQALNLVGKDVIRHKVQKQLGTNNLPMWANMGAGMASGLGAVVVTYPLTLAHIAGAADTAKPDRRAYCGIGAYLQRVVATNGPLGLYRGALVSLVSKPVYRGLQFGIFDTFNRDLYGNGAAGLLAKFSLGQLSSMTASLVTQPFRVVSSRLAANAHVSGGAFSGVIGAFRTTLRTEGVRGLWRGALFNLWSAPTSALVLVLYDEIKRSFGLW